MKTIFAVSRSLRKFGLSEIYKQHMLIISDNPDKQL